ncbi:PKD domain-containing protein [Terrabacter sp. Ter38]|uniref:PKD domain-containing protein n=1 Tax=Terrabacter sp. Ter38 TaxID=2926030 RepID=UPI00211799EC|nr:PKD domain-containing protein [Terrabacter sp. Ter38]
MNLAPRRSWTASRGLRATAIAVSVALTCLGLTPSGATVAHADTAPEAGVPATVTADALPTWQVNGVVWSQVIVGNTVYVTGKFATARPPGVSVGGAGEVPVGNLFAYDIRTGNRVPGFDHVLNAQGLVVHATSDGSRLYVGGDFTSVDGQPRGHIAAFDLLTGALVSDFAPTLDGTVKAITTDGTWVYAGGGFFHAGEVYRQRLVAFAAVNGGISSTWAPRASTSDVRAMVMAPDRSKVIIGGSFLTLSDVTANGMGAVDPIDGTVLPWAASSVIKDYDNGGINSLTTDGTSIYGSGFAFGTGGTFEGSFAANPADGTVIWIADCLGDTYAVYPDADAVYSVGHAHNCSNAGGFPDTNPRVRWQRALATTKTATGTIAAPDAYGWNFTGQGTPSLLHWYPGLEDGAASGQSQAAWSVVGTGDYVALAGEFPIVNNAYQQGLTRFAKRAVAPNLARPRFDVVPAKVVPTVAAALQPGKVRLTYGSAWDRDNELLTYEVFRDSTIVSTTTLRTNFWTTPSVSFTDTGVPAGTHVYKVRVTDPLGNSNYTTGSNQVVVPTAAPAYAGAVLDGSPSAFWRLGESAGPTAYDYTGNGNEATALAGVAFGGAGATEASAAPDTSVSLSGTSTGLLAGATPITAPDTFSVEAWFRTTTTRGGKIIGFGNKTNGSSTVTDRNVYLDNTGHVLFGVNPGSVKTVSSTGVYNDGQWHHVVATLGTDGQRLYVDGQFVSRNVAVTSAQAGVVGQWVLGGDTLTGAASAPTSRYLAGSIDDVAVYPSVLSPATVRSHYVVSGRTAAVAPAPVDPYGAAVTASHPSSYWRLDEASGTLASDASGANETGTYVGTLTRSQAGAVGSGTAVLANGSNGFVASALNSVGPPAYSAEVWFKTTTTKGGKLIGYGDKATGASAVIDRNLTMVNSGALRFSTNNNTAVLDSPATYRDGQWHHAVIAQDAAGMALYVDGARVASNTASATTSFVGYWRFGGDLTWGGSTSSYFGGTLDEAAVYPSALSIADVRAHYRASGRALPNALPTADFSSTHAKRVYSFDATASRDDDGPLTSLAWDFGDGGTASGATAQHTYSKAGNYTVTLKVTDSAGAVATKTAVVTVDNAAPVASFTSAVTGKAVALDASGSSDADAPISSYVWQFGDGATDAGVTANHVYVHAGSYQVTLTVTDSDGVAVATTSTVDAVNATPTAAFTKAVTDLAVDVDAAASGDADGSVIGYAWDFGDGGTASSVSASHTYATGGTYTITLTVTDDDGAVAVKTNEVTVRAANQLPTAGFAATAPSDLLGAFDASASADPDGSVVTYAWTFGDGQTGTGATTQHTYGAIGTYQVGLTVTDDRGGSATTSKAVVITGPTGADTFSRTQATGWGTADTGGVWTLQGAASTFTVAGGVGTIKHASAGAGAAVQLNGLSSTDTDLSLQLSTDKLVNGGGQYVYVTGRGSFSDAYRTKIQVTSSGAVVVALTKVVGNTETTLTTKVVAGLTIAPQGAYTVRTQTFGTSPTTIRAKIWPTGQTQPADWAASITDATATLQVPGAIGLRTYISGTATNLPANISFDNIVARATGN